MSREEGSGWNRRQLLGAATLVALALGVPAGVITMSHLAEDEAPSSRQLDMMRAVAQLVIPATATPGAGDVGAGAFAVLALAHGLDGSRRPMADSGFAVSPLHLRRDGSLRHVDWLESQLDGAAGGDWLAAPADRQRDLLASLDAAAFADGANDHPWRVIKGLILTGYYTSEVGGARELAYEPLPGRFNPRVPVTSDTRAYSNDWTGVEFG